MLIIEIRRIYEYQVTQFQIDLSRRKFGTQIKIQLVIQAFMREATSHIQLTMAEKNFLTANLKQEAVQWELR